MLIRIKARCARRRYTTELPEDTWRSLDALIAEAEGFGMEIDVEAALAEALTRMIGRTRNMLRRAIKPSEVSRLKSP